MPVIRRCRENDFEAVLTIINAAADRYQGEIPDDCWQDPYMSPNALRSEMAANVVFSAMEESDGQIVGVMGVQRMRDVVLIRHAYVVPGQQGKGIGGTLLKHLLDLEPGPILIGTWAAAWWAISFYQRYGFSLVPSEQVPTLLRAYWSISERQAATSVVLANSPVERLAAMTMSA